VALIEVVSHFPKGFANAQFWDRLLEQVLNKPRANCLDLAYFKGRGRNATGSRFMVAKTQTINEAWKDTISLACLDLQPRNVFFRHFQFARREVNQLTHVSKVLIPVIVFVRVFKELLIFIAIQLVANHFFVVFPATGSKLLKPD
jgi:hypothetical protein